MISWVAGIVEGVGISTFWRFAFQIGFLARCFTLPWKGNVPFPAGYVGETEELKFRILEGNRCLFGRKSKWLEMRVYTPFQVKGALSWGDGSMVVTGRYPLAPCLFFGAWLGAWTAGALFVLLEHHYGIGVPFLLLGWAFVGGMLIFSTKLELKRFDGYVKEILRKLEGVPS